jgi:hypothetical protein
MKSVHTHGSVADFTPRVVFADNAADHNREIGRTPSGAERAQLLGALRNAERAHRLRIGIWLPLHQIAFDKSPEFIAKHHKNDVLLFTGLKTWIVAYFAKRNRPRRLRPKAVRMEDMAVSSP